MSASARAHLSHTLGARERRALLGVPRPAPDAVLTLEAHVTDASGVAIELLATEARVTASGKDLEDSVLNFEDRYIEGTAAEVKD